MNILVLTPYLHDTVPGQRFRIEQWAGRLGSSGVQFDFLPFESPRLKRVLHRQGHYPQKAAELLRCVIRRVGELSRLQKIRRWDLIFLYRELMPIGPPIAEFLLSKTGVPLVYDFDDAIFLPDTSDANRHFHWLKMPHKTGSICRWSSHVIVGNEHLRRYALQFTSRVTVIPTTIDLDEYLPKPEATLQRVPVIGWSGSLTTLKHLRTLEPTLRLLAKQLPFRLKVIGSAEYRLPGVEVEAKAWSAATEIEDLRSFDIGVMPLPNDAWSLGKCGLKALQYMAVGVPTIASPVGVNTEIIQDGENGSIADKPEEWIEKILRLVGDKKLREQFSKQGRRTVEEKYSARVQSPVLLETFQKIRAGSQHREQPATRVEAPVEPAPAGARRLQSESVVCVSSIDWDFNWQGHQEIMSTLAEQGNTVLFIENTGIRVPRLKDLPRLGARLSNWRKHFGGIRKIRDRLWVCSPVIFPFPYSRLAGYINRFLLYRTIRAWLRLVGFQNPILWTFLPTRITLDLIDVLDPELVAYYCIADFEELGPSRKVRQAEEKLLRRADVVYAQGELLAQRCRRFHPDVSIFPFGVRSELFEQADLSQIPEDLAKIPRPRIGYVGALQRHVDFELLSELAKRRPDWSLVLVGPSQEPVRELHQLPNVFWLGPRPHEEIPRTMAHFDVCLIPYLVNAYTRTVYPTKLHEYLILGKPVVSTPLPEVLDYNNGGAPLVRIAKNADQFASCIQQALAERDPSLVEQRRQSARFHSWSVRIASMNRILEDALWAKRQARTERWSWILQKASRRSIRRTLISITGSLCAYLLIFQTPFLWWAASPLRLSEPPQQADAIVVFAGGVGESGQAGEGYEERVKRAAELYQKKYAPDLLFISGFTRAFREADVMVILAESLGVPHAAILKETRAPSTKDYVLRVQEAARQRGWSRILLVTSPYHGRRADLTFRHNASELTVVHTPAPESGYYAQNGRITLKQLRGILHEVMGILYYRLRGWI